MVTQNDEVRSLTTNMLTWSDYETIEEMDGTYHPVFNVLFK